MFLFNGEDLGVPVTDLSLYPEGARDIGNECIGDATGGAGVEARYVDVETFDLGRLLKDTNHVVFERGRDPRRRTVRSAPPGQSRG